MFITIPIHLTLPIYLSTRLATEAHHYFDVTLDTANALTMQL